MSSGPVQLQRIRQLHPHMQLAVDCERRYIAPWLGAHAAAFHPRVLDAGCGFQYGLVTHYAGWDVVGLEVDERTVRANADVTWRLVADASVIPLAARAFDLVVCRDVLEHLRDPARTLREFARVLRPGGLAVITTVNVWNPGMWSVRWVPRWLRRVVRRASFGAALGDNAPTFHRANTPARVERAVRDAGLELVALETWPTFLWYFRFSDTLLFGLARLNGWVERLGGQRLFGGMTVVVRLPA